MSHELRTPLNAISGYVDLMRAGVHGPLQPAYEAYADRIRAAQKHLLGLIDNILRFARIEAGQITYTIGEHSVDEQMASVVGLVEPQIASKELTLGCDRVEPALRLLADGEKVTQILLNLLSNAIKFTPGGGTITLSAARNAGRIDVRVADTGCGIAEEQLEAIFEPFVQIDKTLTRESEGVGLGLTISRDLARALGGDLTVASSKGNGSVFTLTLPAA
jgi:signal transduction histidine kinase